MSLIRSASGPAGGLSINTGAANAFGTAASKPSAAGSLFGSSTTSTPTANTTTVPGATGTMSLFGNAAQKPATGNLFGQSTTATATTPAAGGGLFGAAGATNTQQTQGTGNTAQPTTTGTSLFGQSTQNQTQQPQQTGTSLFGQSTATNTQSNTGGLFGQSQAKPATGTTLFGQTQPQQNNTLGQSTNQVSAVQINYDSIRPRTRFDDLAKPVQDEIALLDLGIQRVIKMRDEIGEFMPQHEKDIEQLGLDVKFVESKFRTVQVALNNDIQTVKALQDQTRKNAADARLCFRGADNLKLPTHYHQTGLFASQAPAADSGGADAASTHADAQDLITYFNRICDDIEKYKARLDEYRGDIERDMPGVENGLYEQIRALRDRSAGSVVVQDQLNEVLLALRDTGSAIVAQAGQIADTRERLSRLQAGIVDSGVYAMGMNA
ncbi:Nucleoporin nup45 [Fusarium oxysporum f. sp. cubense race 1]|uniref:Nucleoporin nup45 n=1 Tax=Fusarium oxysporum f. sp. cubense (strain race 1) TaxID=1229664 RepID=N4V250_FUSC1|nr:Nucleoporin nup45 [Fusarium oxysporum f. sp. cubense race 1]